MGSSGARWLGKQSVVKSCPACAVVTPPVMTVRPKMMTSQDLRTVLPPSVRDPARPAGLPIPPLLSAYRSKVLSAIDGMAIRKGCEVSSCACGRRREAMNREGGTTSRGTLHVRSSDPSEGRPLHLALNVPYLLGEVPRACNTTSEPMAHIDGHADVIAVRSRDEDRNASRSREDHGTSPTRRGRSGTASLLPQAYCRPWRR